MGDQIKRYCEKLHPEDYEKLMDNEARVSEGEEFYTDPNCVKTMDKGRHVEICRCSSEKCNKVVRLSSSQVLLVALLVAILLQT